MSGTVFQPDTRTEGVAPCRSAVRYVARSTTLSPGHKLTALSFHWTGSTGLPPAPMMCASTKNAGILLVVVFFNVTVVTVSARRRRWS